MAQPGPLPAQSYQLNNSSPQGATYVTEPAGQAPVAHHQPPLHHAPASPNGYSAAQNAPLQQPSLQQQYYQQQSAGAQQGALGTPGAQQQFLVDGRSPTLLGQPDITPTQTQQPPSQTRFSFFRPRRPDPNAQPGQPGPTAGQLPQTAVPGPHGAFVDPMGVIDNPMLLQQYQKQYQPPRQPPMPRDAQPMQELIGGNWIFLVFAPYFAATALQDTHLKLGLIIALAIAGSVPMLGLAALALNLRKVGGASGCPLGEQRVRWALGCMWEDPTSSQGCDAGPALAAGLSRAQRGHGGHRSRTCSPTPLQQRAMLRPQSPSQPVQLLP